MQALTWCNNDKAQQQTLAPNTFVFSSKCEHMAFLMMRYPQHENDELWLKNKQNDEFPKWFRKKILSELLDDKNSKTRETMWIAEGPNKDAPTFSGYKIIGVTYSTKERDDTRQVHGSGVSVVVDTIVV